MLTQLCDELKLHCKSMPLIAPGLSFPLLNPIAISMEVRAASEVNLLTKLSRFTVANLLDVVATPVWKSSCPLLPLASFQLLFFQHHPDRNLHHGARLSTALYMNRSDVPACVKRIIPKFNGN